MHRKMVTITKKISELDVAQSNVFLSFDDGPDADATPLLLDVLEKYRIKATFSLLGVNAERYPELVRSIDQKGHCIINHGYADTFSIRMKDEKFKNNIAMGEAAISASLGHSISQKLYRPHGGFYNAQQEKLCSEAGYAIAPVTVRAFDAAATSARRKIVINKIVKKTVRDSGGIILLHDCRDSYLRKAANLKRNPNSCFNRIWIVQVVEEAITALAGRGFIFPDPGVYIKLLRQPIPENS